MSASLSLRGAFSVACLLFTSACSADCVPLKADTLHDVYAQLGPVHERAYIDYFTGEPKESARSLGELIELYSRAQCTPATPAKMRDAFQYNELIERGRLVRVHQKLGNADKASSETAIAVKLGQRIFKKPKWSAKDLMELVAQLDPGAEKEVRGGPITK